jgi:DNA-binding MarR family transcriptional regulator
MRRGVEEPYPEAKEGDKACYVTPEEVSWMFNNLTQSAQGVLLYLRAEDPGEGRRRVIEPKEIAKLFACSERTVHRALQELEALELIEYQKVKARQEVKTYISKTLLPPPSERLRP